MTPPGDTEEPANGCIKTYHVEREVNNNGELMKGTTMNENNPINWIRETARLRVERLNSKPGQRATSKMIVISSQLVPEIGLDVPADFDFAAEQVFVETFFHNNNGELIATDHRISRRRIDSTEEPQFVRFGVGEFMSDRNPVFPSDVKEQIVNLSRENQKEIYRWMYDALECRIF